MNTKETNKEDKKTATKDVVTTRSSRIGAKTHEELRGEFLLDVEHAEGAVAGQPKKKSK